MKTISHRIGKTHAGKRIRKSLVYARLRQHFPMPDWHYLDDSASMPETEKVLIDWPLGVRKPVVGVIRDYDPYPRWTKYCRFLENNSFPYEFYDLHSSQWIEQAATIDIVVGVLSSEFSHLMEMRRKYYILEKYLGKLCFPSFDHIMLYEDKALEMFISQVTGIQFAPTHMFFEKQDALQAVGSLHYPLVSKIIPGSGSLGVEWVRDQKQAERIINRAFSRAGRATHSLYFRQKDYVYFQDYIPNDGYDLRVILVNQWVFGYYRKVLEGDFRASGMKQEEYHELPEAAIRVARQVNAVVKSPLLAVDMVRALDGQYYVIEYSPLCQLVETPARELQINGVPGAYFIEAPGSIDFREGLYWIHELSLREFLLSEYLPRVQCKEDRLTYSENPN